METILNPKSGRMVLQHGIIGQRIMEEYKHKITIPLNVSGPISVRSLYIKERDMYIHIFGDQHKSNQGVCDEKDENEIKIEHFIKMYLDYNIKNKLFKYPIDFFMEGDYEYHGRCDNPRMYTTESFLNCKKPPDEPLIRIMRMYADCGYYRKKIDCPYNSKEVRIHYSDIRKLIKLPMLMEEDEEEKLADRLVSIGIEKFVDEMANIAIDALKDPKIAKQADMVDKPLQEHFYERCKQDILHMSFVLYAKKFDPEDSYDVLQDITNMIRIQLFSSIFDYYNLCRMFRYFGKNKSNTCNRVICYFGDSHSRKIFEIISSYRGHTCKVLQQLTPIGKKVDLEKRIVLKLRCLENVLPLFTDK